MHKIQYLPWDSHNTIPITAATLPTIKSTMRRDKSKGYGLSLKAD